MSLKCTYPTCTCHLQEVNATKICPVDDKQKFCTTRVNGQRRCDWEYNPMHGGNECNTCASFTR